MKQVLLMLLTLLMPATALAEVNGDTCAPFYQALKQRPHESIFQQNGLFNSRAFESGAYGCFLVMLTSEKRLGERSLPDLSGDPGSDFYSAGWRSNPNYTSDGPGTGVVGLEKDDALCLIYTDQSALLDDSRKIVQDRFINVRVECLPGKRAERIILKKVIR